jgi:hypothetical protein
VVIEVEERVRADCELPTEIRAAALERFRHLHLATSRRALLALGIDPKAPS